MKRNMAQPLGRDPSDSGPLWPAGARTRRAADRGFLRLFPKLAVGLEPAGRIVTNSATTIGQRMGLRAGAADILLPLSLPPRDQYDAAGSDLKRS